MPNPSIVEYLQRTTNKVDGWALNHAVIPNAYSYQALSVGSMSLRYANNFKPKVYAVPDVSQFGAAGIPPFSNGVYQVRITPGSFILGCSLTITNYFGTPEAKNFSWQNNFYVAVMDDSTGIPLFSDWLTEALFNVPVLWNDPSGAPSARQTYVPKTAWFPLTKPRPVVDPGTVTVEFSYKGTVTPASQNIAPQVVIMCAEPCSDSVQPEQCK